MKQFALVGLFCSHVAVTTAFSVPLSLPLRSDFWPTVTVRTSKSSTNQAFTVTTARSSQSNKEARSSTDWCKRSFIMAAPHFDFCPIPMFLLNRSFTANFCFFYKLVLSHLLLNNSGCCSRCNCGALALSRRCSSWRYPFYLLLLRHIFSGATRCCTQQTLSQRLSACSHASRFKTSTTTQNLHSCACCMLIWPVWRQASLSSYVGDKPHCPPMLQKQHLSLSERFHTKRFSVHAFLIIDARSAKAPSFGRLDFQMHSVQEKGFRFPENGQCR